MRFTHIKMAKQNEQPITIDDADTVRRMQEIYEAQVSGQVDSGNPELLTPINLADGNAARRQLDALYANWFEPEYLAETQRLMAA